MCSFKGYKTPSTLHCLILNSKSAPQRGWAAPSNSAKLGQPLEGAKQASDHLPGEKIDVISSGQCPPTRYYTGKNSYFYLILAFRPRSDELRGRGASYVLEPDCNDCGFR